MLAREVITIREEIEGIARVLAHGRFLATECSVSRGAGRLTFRISIKARRVGRFCEVSRAGPYEMDSDVIQHTIRRTTAMAQTRSDSCAGQSPRSVTSAAKSVRMQTRMPPSKQSDATCDYRIPLALVQFMH